jgi:alanyl-tRNA synthetase
VALVATFSDAVVKRGLSAAEVIQEVAQIVGGGGGGRENVAQAGGKDASKLDEALAAARDAIEAKLAS